MIIGVYGVFGADFAAQHFDGAVRDHLVGVHVRLRTRPGLPNDQREVIIQLAGHNFGGRSDDGISQLGVQFATIFVGFGAGWINACLGEGNRRDLARQVLCVQFLRN